MAALAIPLAVLSLATAVKDIVEVAQQIQDAFKQVPENYRKARKMSEEILRFAEHIKLLYEEEKDVFERKSRYKKLLEDLLREMNGVHEQCAKLVPPLSVKTITDRLKVAFYKFRNREKVMNLVSELKTQTDCCYNQFLVASNILQVASNIRIEANIDRITQNVQSLSTSIVSSTTDTRLAQFMQSYSFPIPQMRRSIPEHELRIEYITMQLGSCKQSLETFMSKCFQIPSMPLPADSIPKATWELRGRPLHELEYHDQVVYEIISVRSMLRYATPADFVNIIKQAHAVASALSDYEMVHEAATVVEWVTRTWRKMTSILPSNCAKCYLAQCLRENAVYLGRIGEFDKACDYIDEGMRIANSLILQTGGSPSFLNIMADLLSTYSALSSRATRQSDNSQELACRAVAFAEQSVVETCSSSLGGKLIDLRTSSGLTDITMAILEVNSVQKKDLSDCLYSLLDCLEKLCRYPEGTDHQMLGLQVAHLLLRFYPDSLHVLESAAYLLSKLCSNRCVSINVRLEYAKELVDVYRQLFQVSQSSRYILPLSKALLSYSNILSSLKMYRENEDVLREVTSLAEVASHEYFDMSLPSKAEANYYLHIAEMHDTQGRRQDAILAARNAAAHYTGLQIIDKDRDPLNHLKSLAMLCRLYYDSGQYQCTLSEGHKAFTIAANSIDRYPEILAEDSLHLESLTEILDVLKNLSRGSIPGTVAKTSPSFQQFINLFESELANPMVLRVYAQILLTLPLWPECYQFDRRCEIKHAIDLVDKLIHNPNMLNLKRQLIECHIGILIENCQFQEALQHSQNIATMYSDYNQPGISDNEFIYHSWHLFWSQIYTHIPHDAIDVAKEILGPYQQECKYHPYLLANALFDAGEVEEGLSCILEAINEENDESQKDDYMWQASQLHFVMRNYSEAKRILDEVIGYCVTFRRGEVFDTVLSLRQLGQILFAGLMFCCSGDHENGREALSTFAGYIEDKISVSGPVVIHIIRLGLNAEQKRGKWKLIQASAKSALQCDHMGLVLNGSWAEIAAPHL